MRMKTKVPEALHSERCSGAWGW